MYLIRYLVLFLGVGSNSELRPDRLPFTLYLCHVTVKFCLYYIPLELFLYCASVELRGSRFSWIPFKLVHCMAVQLLDRSLPCGSRDVFKLHLLPLVIHRWRRDMCLRPSPFAVAQK